MKGKCFFDTNVLVYALKINDPNYDVATNLLLSGGVISIQTLNEFTSVVRRKLKMPWPDVIETLRYFRELCSEAEPLTVSTHERALNIAQRWRYHIYDSLIIASALEAGCDTLYSEDMQHGQVIEGLKIRDPFRELRPH